MPKLVSFDFSFYEKCDKCQKPILEKRYFCHCDCGNVLVFEPESMTAEQAQKVSEATGMMVILANKREDLEEYFKKLKNEN